MVQKYIQVQDASSHPFFPVTYSAIQYIITLQGGMANCSSWSEDVAVQDGVVQTFWN